MNIEEILEKLPPAPPGVVRWIRKSVIEGSYIIYNKKEDKAVCTRCGHTFRASRFDMKHNEEGKCPKCKSRAVYKASGIGRKNLTEYFRVLIFAHRGNTVYGTLTEVAAEFKEMGKPQLSKWLSAVYTFNKDEQSYYKHVPEGFWQPEHWEKRKDVKLPRPPQPCSFFATPKLERTETYMENLENVFMHSSLKYGWQPDLFERQEFTPYDYISYISLHLKYQSIELLIKGGFESLVSQKVSGRQGSSCINWRGKSLEKILRLPRRHIRKLRGHDPDFCTLKGFQGLNEEEKSLPWSVIKRVASVRLSNHYFDAIENYIDVIKWAEWADKEDVYQGDWIDYIRDCKRLGLDIRKKSVLVPDNFDIIHMELSQKIDEEENREKNEKMEAVARDYMIDLKDENFLLAIAKSQTELNMESAALCHCVRTYGDQVAAGRTIIYFIRKKSDPDKPYYTLEIHPDGTFIQCRGERNCIMTKEVEDFKDRVVAEFNRMLKKRERSVA